MKAQPTMIIPFFITLHKEDLNMTSASEIVESYQAALSKGDFATARTLMQDNMTFQGPLDTFNKADDYLEAFKKLASIIQRIDLKKIFVRSGRMKGSLPLLYYVWCPNFVYSRGRSCACPGGWGGHSPPRHHHIHSD